MPRCDRGIRLPRLRQRLGGERSRRGDQPAPVGIARRRHPVDERLDVDAVHEGVDVDPFHQGVHIHTLEQAVDVDAVKQCVRLDPVEEVVQLQRLPSPVGLVDAEAHRTKHASQKSHVSLLVQLLGQLIFFDHECDVVNAQDIGLGLLERRVQFLQLEADFGVATVDRDLARAETVREFVHQRVAEVRFENHQVHLLGYLLPLRRHDFIEYLAFVLGNIEFGMLHIGSSFF